MTNLTKTKILFAILYFVQGGAISYFSLFQKPYLNSLGVERSTIALLSTLLLLPFVLKIFFGYLSDHYPSKVWGHRKPYMFFGLLIACLAFFFCGIFTPDNFLVLYALLVLTASFCVALFDAATDGLAIDVVPSEEQGPVQSYMVGGKALGVIVLSLSIGHLVSLKGYSFVFFTMAGVFLVPLFLTFMIKPKAISEETEDDKKGVKVSFKDIPFWGLAFLGVSYSVVSFGSDGLVTLYLTDQFKISEEAIGFYGSLRGLGAIIGSLAAGHLLIKLNENKVKLSSLALIACGVLMLGHLTNATNYQVIAILWGACWGFQEVCFLALVMKILKGTHSAFAFASLMAMANLGTAIGEGIATYLTQNISFSLVFTILATLIIIPFFLLISIFKKTSDATALQVNI